MIWLVAAGLAGFIVGVIVTVLIVSSGEERLRAHQDIERDP